MEAFFDYFWLLAIAINGLNAAIAWGRAQSYIQENPDLRSGYGKIIPAIFLGMTLPWGVMGLGLILGGVAHIGNYFYPRSGQPWVIAWWVSLWLVILLWSYWIGMQGGAEMLIKHPGLFRHSPRDPRSIQWMTLLLLLVTTANSVLVFSLKPR